MANPELGAKQVCPNCQSKFYDLNRRPAVCPKCDTSFDPEEVVRSRRARPRGAGPDYESEEDVKPKVAEEGEDAEEHAETPEIDEAPEADTLGADDEDDSGHEKPEADGDLGVDFEEEGAELESESEDVPFLEEEEDEADFAGEPVAPGGEGEER